MPSHSQQSGSLPPLEAPPRPRRDLRDLRGELAQIHEQVAALGPLINRHREDDEENDSDESEEVEEAKAPVIRFARRIDRDGNSQFLGFLPPIGGGHSAQRMRQMAEHLNILTMFLDMYCKSLPSSREHGR